MHRTLAAFEQCRHPLVAMIKGICVGGGLEIAANCDLRICGESSRFGAPVNQLGLVMAHAEMRGLLALVGRAAALEILLEGRVFGAHGGDAERAWSRASSPDDKVEEEAYATARRIAAGAPLVARWHKKFAARLADPRPLSEAEIDEGFACFGTEDFRIGYRAFLAKSKPRVQGPLTMGPLAGAQGDRAGARHGRADLRLDAGRHGRRRDQGGEDCRTATTSAARSRR